MEKRVVATITSGVEAAEQGRVSHPLMRAYAESQNADFHVVSSNHLGQLWAGFAKLTLGPLLGVYDRLLYIDTDILIRPGSPSLFDLVQPSTIGATVVDHLSPEEAPAVANGWIANDIELSQSLFGHIGWASSYFNSGVMVLSREHKCMFDESISVAEVWSNRKDRIFADQTLFNYFAAKNAFSVTDLGHQFNHTPAFNRRAHRYASYFSHYVRLRRHRRGTRAEQMAKDAWICRHPRLRRFLANHPFLAGLQDRL